MTLYAAKRLYRGRVLSFEPVPGLFAQLCDNVALNHFPAVELFNIGLYDREAVLPIYVREDNSFGIANDGVSSLFRFPNDRPQTTVQLRKFDDLARELDLQRVDFLKVDVESAEWMVLKGAEQSLRAFRPVIVAESSAGNFKKAGYTAKDLYNYLESLDYEIRALVDGSTRLPQEGDVLCIPRH